MVELTFNATRDIEVDSLGERFSFANPAAMAGRAVAALMPFIAAERARADTAERLLNEANSILEYISQPTMGLPAGIHPAMFATRGASEHDVRYALVLCINQARAFRGKDVQW